MSDLYAVFGNPIAHSKSPQIHAMFAAQCGQDIDYQKRLAPLDGFAASIQAFIAEGGRGANVTVPFKEQAFALAQHLSQAAQCARAVNTLRFTAHGIEADNTDGAGLVRDLKQAGQTLQGKRILLLGAGGAARGALLPLLQEGPALVHIANRSLPRAQALAQDFASLAQPGQLDASALHAASALAQQPWDLIINATSSSLQEQGMDLPDALFAHTMLAYDMVYGSALTPFLQQAQAQGVAVRDGLGMLVQQAALAFAWWRGVLPDTGPVYAALR
ncbi:shikimate dehydrogenase [Massilia sp. W12]|uniref:shikimate dehydrogenase n=1 Tax=Massilia sp. W12 TaxID=3126507 RepID=UPI0030D6023A